MGLILCPPSEICLSQEHHVCSHSSRAQGTLAYSMRYTVSAPNRRACEFWLRNIKLGRLPVSRVHYCQRMPGRTEDGSVGLGRERKTPHGLPKPPRHLRLLRHLQIQRVAVQKRRTSRAYGCDSKTGRRKRGVWTLVNQSPSSRAHQTKEGACRRS